MKKIIYVATLTIITSTACKKDNSGPGSKNPDQAPKVSVDRFSSSAGHLMIRTSNNGLPAANVPVNFDNAPFITRGYTPNGQITDYYNFDIQPLDPAPIYVLFRQGAGKTKINSPVEQVTIDSKEAVLLKCGSYFTDLLK